MLYCIQRGDPTFFAPCHNKDRVYGALVLEAAARGVQIMALRFAMNAEPGQACFIGFAQLDLLYGRQPP